MTRREFVAAAGAVVVSRRPKSRLRCLLGFSYHRRSASAPSGWALDRRRKVATPSGASLLPGIFQALARNRHRHALVFVGFTGEEKGLAGSKAYLKQFKKDGTQRVRAMVNMDTLGLGPAVIWLSYADPRLAATMVNVAAALEFHLIAVNVDHAGSTDSEPFRERKIPAITIHSLTQET